MTRDQNNPMIRPPTLTIPTNSVSSNDAPGINMASQRDQLESIVFDILTQRGRSMIENIIRPSHEETYGIDQPVAIEYIRKFDELNKIPDVVKCLREFDGSNPNEFSSWKQSVDRILKIFEPERITGTMRYFGIINVIRNKICG
jgi:hypothetical protein